MDDIKWEVISYVSFLLLLIFLVLYFLTSSTLVLCVLSIFAFCSVVGLIMMFVNL
jgi:hypothetical protein